MRHTRVQIVPVVLSAVLTLGTAPQSSAPQPAGAPSVARNELLSQVLPPGNFRTVLAVAVDLPPGVAAPRHRHDVAVMAYVLEGTVENQFNAGEIATYKTGQAWWEAPGTVHDVARNPSQTERARLLIVYIGEEGKTRTVPLN
jgi:quercetin dioxygenase-like cupin family protein